MCVKYFKLDFRYICMRACIYMEYFWKDTEKIADCCLKGGRQMTSGYVEGDLLYTEYCFSTNSLLPV